MPDKEESDGGVCPVIRSIRVMGPVWRVAIIRYLLDGPRGFNELLKTVPGLDAKTLSRTLKHLQRTGLVERGVLSTQPFAVEYSLTKMGLELKPVIGALGRWCSRRSVEAVGSEPYKHRVQDAG